ncbi:MAG: class II aldolase/adducin family protein [Clostridium sp.]|jgi:L-fuculose-phosphate aldolase|uniref:class II aldolase/adducin family protein n=1 Tax=Clostridium sp. TaxID=1506 RepID=UPI0025C0136E|nr:class II aldolase/adducin family protein [Clostridium sp.]MCH3965858.1 class II aldolase/adducin family protein [Clostridium sp.]MCI1716053.1 class II aldolase/adducin family protein [Clostridium sp.]MCI1800275.1 class II aldolase/adducin family protein [Clostridium sp.]MCI1814230.1 class II aldolase/adducin family protein [Clostridium sp.]MCI1871129.1 class II aldolase/adducin family protein [Clostridium sp.]
MLEELKKELVNIAKEADSSGLCRHKSGNFSIRDRKTGYVIVTPTGVDRKELTYHDICVVDTDANVVEIETNVKPTSEFLVHIAVYKTRKDVNSVIHTHSKFATAFAVLGKAIPSIVYECANLKLKDGIIPVAPYGTPGTTELSNSVIKPIQRADAILLESHGVVTVDEDPKEALLKAHYVEELAGIYYRALMINGGKEPKVVPIEEIQKWKYPSQIKF